MLRTNIYLSESQTEALDALAHQQGVSRAEVVRAMIDAGLSRGPTSAARMAAVNESFGILRDMNVTERGMTERDEYLDQVWQS